MSLSNNYKEILENAIKAIHERTFYSQYPEHPKAYGEEAPAEGLKAFENRFGKKFELLKQGTTHSWIGVEESPYKLESLKILYPAYNPATVIANASQALKSWKNVNKDLRAEVLIDSLERIKNRFFEIAYATMHTTGQSFMMSFQASGPHSNDRALEALALGYQEVSRFPSNVTWKKPMGKFSVTLEKTFNAIPKGISLVIGCSTFPVWNSVPGIYASLITGNPVIVKPHPKAVLPIAIVVEEIQNALADKGLNPKVAQLAVDIPKELITKKYTENHSIKIIDYTGGSTFGNYVENLKGKTVFTEKAGVNSVIIDSTSDLNAMLQNLAFAVSLYSGQMCTAPQNFFIPKNGINAGGKQVSYDEIVEGLKKNISGLANHPKMGAGTLGAIQSRETENRVKNAGTSRTKTILKTGTIENPEFENARICTPAILEVEASDSSDYEKELFGPIVIVVKTENSGQSIELAKKMAAKHGAITCAAYCTDEAISQKIESEMESVFVPVSLNLTGMIWVNQHAAFSDFHVTGGNPAGNASFTNPEFVNKRFVWVGHRRVEG